MRWNGILLNNKEEQNNAVCSSMNGPRDCLTERTKSEQKDKYHDIAYTWNPEKSDTNEFNYKAEVESQMQKTSLWVPRDKGEG